MKRSGQTEHENTFRTPKLNERSGGQPSETNGSEDASSLQSYANEVEEFLQHARRAAQSGTAALNRTVQQNPTLALAGLVAFGALAAVAIRQRRAKPETLARQLQSDMIRHTSSMRKAIRQEIRDSGIGSKFDSIGASMSAIDWKPYIQPFLEKAAAVADDAKTKIASVTK